MTSWLEAVLDPEGELPLLCDSWRSEAFRPRRFLAVVRELLPVLAPPAERRDRLSAGSGLVFLGDPDAGHRLLLDAGPTCPERLPAHGHADTFTFELHLHGRPMVVDPGLFEYASGAMRDYCRSTRAHSTVTVDDADSSEVWSSFRIGRRARVRDLEFSRRGRLGTVTARHDGYLDRGVEHARTARHLGTGSFLVVDGVRGRGAHAISSRIHLHPEAVLEHRPAGGFHVHCRGAVATVLATGPERIDVEPGWHCPDFGRRLRSQVLVLRTSGPPAAPAWLILAGEHGDAKLWRDGAVVRGAVGDLAFSEAVP
jgi:hypothetical protein